MNDIRRFLKYNKERNIILLEEVSSTNDYAKILAANGESSGSIVIANFQTNGKGRLGKSFYSPENIGIYMSIILRLDYDLETVSLLTSCMAVAASRAIDYIYDTDMKIKWVNDLYLNGKKISGILTESTLNPKGKLDFVIVGIGVNVKSIKKTFSSELLEIASSLEDETGKIFSIGKIAAEIINQFEMILPTFEQATFIEEYRKRSCIIGHDVIISKNNREPVAKAVGIDDRAGLIVEYSDGRRETLTSGEARVKV